MGTYDEVGNRINEGRGMLDLDGTYNPLNQLIERKFGGKLDVIGAVTGTNAPLNVMMDGDPAAMFPISGGADFHGGARVKPGTNIISIVSKDAAGLLNETNRVVQMPATNPQKYHYEKTVHSTRQVFVIQSITT